MGAGIPTNLPLPVFVPDADGLDPNLIVADIIALFQTASGRTLRPAQVERLIVNLIAYREALLRNAIQYAGEQNLLAFATAPMLDYLGQLLGVTRLAAVGAVCTLQFTLVDAQVASVIIPAGTQVATEDGLVVFATDADLTIAAGATIGSTAATATTTGTAGNGYVAGQVSVPVTPDALVSAVANTDTSSGGAAPEADAALQARIQQAPNEFSVAGPASAYRFFAVGADPSIIDAQVLSPAPGQVTVYILCGPITAQPAASPNNAGIAGATLIAKVLAALSADTVRPLDDTVAVAAVTEVDYSVTATITTYSDATPSTALAAAQAAAAQLAIDLASRVQRDIVPSQFITALSIAGMVYEVTLSITANIGGTPLVPQADGRFILEDGQWANATQLNISQVTGTEHS